MRRKSVFSRYLMVLSVLLLAFVRVFGLTRAQENSQRMRTGGEPEVVDAQDVREFAVQAIEELREIL